MARARKGGSVVNSRVGKKLGSNEDSDRESVRQDIKDGYRCNHGVNIPEPCTECPGGKATQIEHGECDSLAPSDVGTMQSPERVADRLLQEERAVERAIAEGRNEDAERAMRGDTLGRIVQGVGRVGFATQLAKQRLEEQKKLAAGSGVMLTDEQADILATAKQIEEVKASGQRVLVIAAGAGTGKTFTLKQLERVLKGRGQYTAFNKSLVEESRAKFVKAAVATTHSLAYRAVGYRYSHRLNGARQRSAEIARRLGIEDYVVELPEDPFGRDGNGNLRTKTLKGSWLAGQVLAGIRRFCTSADREMGASHLHAIPGVDGEKDGQRDYANSNKIREYLLPFMKKAWADLASETGTLPFWPDVYVKLWQLGEGPNRPVIAADYILLDEAQDTAPVMLDILRQQSRALLILVGDDNQQIYEWRGAVNAMAAFEGAPRRLLSQSFRFGQSIADVANAVLAGLEQPTDLVMRGLESIPSRICEVESPRCYLYRTNAGAVARLMKARQQGKRGHLIGGTKEVVEFCQAAQELQQGRRTQHPELGCFDSWEEVQDYAKSDEGQDLRLMVKLIDAFTAEEIIAALKGMPDEEDADLVVSTAHRSKGREWSSVRLGPDFPTANKLTDADRRLIYVAVTRAQEELDVSDCPTFAGGYDRSGGSGQAEESGPQWIPGIEVHYTQPMPSEEDLAAYRGSEDKRDHATAAPAEVPQGASAPTPAPVAADKEEYTWANLNGQWCVRGPAGKEGQCVTVTRKNGTTSEETLRSVVKELGNLWFYAIK